MYRAILVEDEPWALMGIRKFLEHGSDQFQTIYETTNPIQALDAILTMQPDVVFTDIRMPEISGLDLMAQIRQKGLDTPFIVISGFSEFSYAQQALQLGALDYLLKPLNIMEAADILGHIVQKLDAQREMDDYRLYAMLHSRGGDPSALLRSRMGPVLWPHWQVVMGYFTGEGHTPDLLPADTRLLHLPLGPHRSVFVANSREDVHQALHNCFRNSSSDMIYCGFSQTGNDVGRLPAMLQEAENGAYDHFVHPTQKVCCYTKPQPVKVFHIQQTLWQLLREGRPQQLRNFLQHLPDHFMKQRLNVMDAWNLWNIIADNLPQDFPDAAGLVDIIPMNVHAFVEAFGNLETMCRYLADMLLPHSFSEDGSVAGHFSQLLGYIATHYMDELNLQQLCDLFYINVSYCCQLFRKETQCTFTQYISRLRMKHACELLESTALPIKKVCESVGYNDYFYFDKVFKKNLGCTPSEYRKRHE